VIPTVSDATPTPDSYLSSESPSGEITPVSITQFHYLISIRALHDNNKKSPLVFHLISCHFRGIWDWSWIWFWIQSRCQYRRYITSVHQHLVTPADVKGAL
jgi:hypothetical protein